LEREQWDRLLPLKSAGETSVATNIVTADHSFSDAELDAFMASIPVTEFATV